MNKRQLLLELGCEELPEKHLDIALESVERSFKQFLMDNALACTAYQVSGTPRRIYLMAEGLDEKQADIEVEKLGPSVNIAYNAEGKLSPAGLGFLKKCGASEDDCSIMETEKGKFLAVKYLQVGKHTEELLKLWIENLIPAIPFTKKMIWKDAKLSFSRPLRWIVALWGNEVLGLELGGIKSGRISYGNRYLGMDKELEITSVDSYLTQLDEVQVIAQSDKRKNMIREQLAEIFNGTEYRIVEDQRLVDTVCNLVESPNAVVAEFGSKYLTLPEKIIISTISQNQKYFSVTDETGKLANKFVFISNGDPQYASVIKEGNQKVVNARLADAMWYYNEDTKVKLESFVPKLKDVVFQSRIGTMEDKSHRVLEICRLLAKELKLTADETDMVLRCALLCKSDLVTTMLGEKEFTKLQGYIGKQYALASGEEAEVAQGIYEHYMPRGSADDLPATLCGNVVAVADKIDTVAGIIGAGMMPTGSGDPFALRRAANGIVQIINAQAWDIDLYALADYALNLVSAKFSVDEKARDNLHGFLEQRVVWLLKQQDIAYDVIDSVMHIDKSHINDLESRARALNSLKSEEGFIKLVIGFKRVANIIGETKVFAPLKPELLHEPAEKHIHNGLHALHAAISEALVINDYRQALQHLIHFGAAIDEFFEQILVNCDDAETKANRHALLKEIRQEFLRVADLSLIVLDIEG